MSLKFYGALTPSLFGLSDYLATTLSFQSPSFIVHLWQSEVCTNRSAQRVLPDNEIQHILMDSDEEAGKTLSSEEKFIDIDQTYTSKS